MPTFDDRLARIRDRAGAEFAFALTLTAQLATSDAPRDMPEIGRNKLVQTALANPRAVSALAIPRRDIVPYGGAAPIDVSLAVAGEMVFCVVTTSREGRAAAKRALEPEIKTAEPQRARPRKPKNVEDSSPSIEIHGPARLGRASMVAIERDDVPQITVTAGAKLGRETLVAIELDEAPEITVTPEAKLGRETLVAIELDESPEITVTPGAKFGRETLAAINRDLDKHEAPEIAVEPARGLGRETLTEIAKDIVASGPAAKPPPIPVALRRKTLPWIEQPEELRKKKKR